MTFTSKDIPSFVQQLKEQEEGIWLVGGGEIITFLLEHKLVGEVLFRVILIGEGIPLLPVLKNDIPLKLNHTKSWDSGVVELNYSIST
ncbi:MAG: dihydrofolate reductase [Polaribacter sp.]